MQQQSSHLRNKLHIVQAIHAKKELTDRGRSEEKSQKRRESRKSLQAAGTRQYPYGKQLLIAEGTKLYLKVTSWEGVKRSRLVEAPHFSFLPSLAASCVAAFLFFEISKLENWAIKLVEIALGKHNFPNFLVKKGKFCPKKKHCCLLYRQSSSLQRCKVLNCVFLFNFVMSIIWQSFPKIQENQSKLLIFYFKILKFCEVGSLAIVHKRLQPNWASSPRGSRKI